MGLGKTYSADYLIDSNGNTGVSGQVLISTATGIDWADGSAITGGPFLPLAGGTLTGNLTISNASPALNLTDTDNASNISFSSVGGALIVNSSSDQVYQIAGAEKMRINSSGNVGIGHSVLHQKFTVNGNIDIRGGDSSLLTFNNGDGGISVHYNNADSLDGRDIAFKTYKEGVGNTEKMRITRDGNVGIGTAGPSQKLTVVGNTYVSSGLLLLDNNQDIRWGDAGERITGNNTNGLVFTTNNFETMRINSQGKVGIGTTDPGSLLQVGGLDDGSNYDITLGWNAVDSEAVGTKRSAITFKTAQTSVNTEDIYKWDIAMLAAPATVTGEEFGSDLAFLRSTRGSTATDATTMILTRTGNVGIGATSPSSKLQVSGDAYVTEQFGQGVAIANKIAAYGGEFRASGASAQIFFGRSGSSVGSGAIGADSTYVFRVWTTPGFGNPFVIKQDGNVGIGTTSPSEMLEIKPGSGGDSKINMLDSAGAQKALIGYDNGNGGLINLYNQAGTRNVVVRGYGNSYFNGGNFGIGTVSPAAKLDVVASNVSVTPNTDSSAVFRKNGHNYISILSGGTNEGGVIFGNSADAADGWIAYKHGTGAADQAFAFGTANGERMRITKGGNVGIGTTAPGAKLDINGIPWVNPADGTHSGWNFRQGGVFKGWVGYVDSNDVVNLSMDGSVTNGINVNASHNVGIGTASPTHKLHVNGDMRLTGALRDSNNAKGSAGQVLSSTGSATDWIPLPATPTIYTPKVYNLNNSTNINSQGQKLVPDFGTLEIEGNTTVQQVSGSDTDFQVTDENTGIYEVTYAVFYKNTGNQRTPLGTYLTLNGTAVNGSLMVNYVRSNVTGGGNWSSCTNTFYVNVTDASHPMALCVRRADSSTAPSGISMVEPAGMAVKSTISFRRIS